MKSILDKNEGGKNTLRHIAKQNKLTLSQQPIILFL